MFTNLYILGDNYGLKYISLIILCIQNVTFNLTLHHLQTCYKDTFVSSTAIICSEMIKCTVCLVILYIKVTLIKILSNYIFLNKESDQFIKCNFSQEGNFQTFLQSLATNILDQPLDNVKIAVPAILYLVQNNLVYYAMARLDVATFQVNCIISFCNHKSIMYTEKFKLFTKRVIHTFFQI